MPPRHPYTIFYNCHYFGKWTLCVCLDLAKVFLQGATTPHLYHFLIVILGGGHYVCFDLAKVLQGATTPPLHHFFNCHYCGKAALCFCFDLATVFFQDATSFLKLLGMESTVFCRKSCGTLVITPRIRSSNCSNV